MISQNYHGYGGRMTHCHNQHSTRTCYLLFDERMALHRPPQAVFKQFPEEETDVVGPCENSSRIIALYRKMMELEDRLVYSNSKLQTAARRFISLNPKFCKRSTLLLAHTERHVENMLRTSTMTNQELNELCEKDNDLYYCRDTFLAASLAAGGVVTACDAVLSAAETGIGPTRAIALVRPPGHHALADAPMGFCYFNNIAVAAKNAIHTGSADRVFILDWDIHHGNGIQDITYDDPNIFYLSIHRANFGTSKSSQAEWFYPGTGRHDQTGKGSANGTNLNIVFPTGGMGNAEYAAAFAELVIPTLRSFHPDLIIVACGLDAAKGDLLGDCGLSSDMYYIMTRSLLETCGSTIPLVVALEGGYHLDVIAKCMEATALALLDEPYPLTDEMGNPVPQKEIKLSHYYKNETVWSETGGAAAHPREESQTMARALRSIRKSARALAKTGRYPWLPRSDQGSAWMQPSASSTSATNMLSSSYSSWSQTKKCQHRGFVSTPIVMLCNRPVQGRYLVPPASDYSNQYGDFVYRDSKLNSEQPSDADDDSPMDEDDDMYNEAGRPVANERFPFKKRRFIHAGQYLRTDTA